MPSVLKKSIQELSAAEIAALPKATRWRAERRGWIAVDYHQRFTNVRILASPQFQDEAEAVYCQARKIVGYVLAAGWGFPAHCDRDDLIQECVIELWRCSAKADFQSSKWRGEVMFRHLYKLRGQCRFDRDKFNRRENYDSE